MKKYYQYIDHTILKAETTYEEIDKLCEEYLEYGMASVCIPPSYVKYVKEKHEEAINICTVIGFPLGYMTTENKVNEAKNALKNGANEIDMVINIGSVKNREFENVLAEIRKIKEVCGEHILKVIVETCYLNEEEIIKMCQLINQSEADFIKTSTGFGTEGATVENICLFKKHIDTNVKMKAAGGIRTFDELKGFIDLGCTRIGTSSAIKLLS